MRRTVAVSVVMLAMLAMLAPPVFAQAPAPAAPAPKVTITGLVDQVMTYQRNRSMSDLDITRDKDREWVGWTRGRFDFIGEVGKAKAVLGLELDLTYGQAGAADNSTTAGLVGAPSGARVRAGQSGGFDADTDVLNVIEIKWMYVEAPVTGPGSLLSFIPVAGTGRFGGQPYTVTYRPSMFAQSDFGGVNLDFSVAPNLRTQFTYAQLEEKSDGTRFGFKDEDIGFIALAEYSPFKGLDIKPIYAIQELAGTTSSLVRRGIGGIAQTATNFPGKAQEWRHSVGLDARWRSGPFSVMPTFIYQFGDRTTYTGVGATGGQRADIHAWFLDVEAGWQIGPLLLETRPVVTSGNKARDNLRKEISYYQQFANGNFYYYTWSATTGLGNVDYLSSLGQYSNFFAESANIGYDRYGRVQVGVRATYSVTPALAVYGVVTPMWTYEKVDTDGTATAAAGITPSAEARGDSRYLGVDTALGLRYRFAPGLTFETVYGYLFAGRAYDLAPTPGAAPREAKDVSAWSSQLRFAF